MNDTGLAMVTDPTVSGEGRRPMLFILCLTATLLMRLLNEFTLGRFRYKMKMVATYFPSNEVKRNWVSSEKK